MCVWRTGVITTLVRADSLARRVALRYHDARVGGSIPGLGSFNTVTCSLGDPYHLIPVVSDRADGSIGLATCNSYRVLISFGGC